MPMKDQLPDPIHAAITSLHETTIPLESIETSTLETKSKTTCRPFHRIDFYARLATFSSSTWFAKPDQLNPLICAQYGWENVDIDCIQCSSCQALYCFYIDPILSLDSIERIVIKYYEQLKSGHLSDCPWYGNPSPESFIRMPTIQPSQMREKCIKDLESSISGIVSTQLWYLKQMKVSSPSIPKELMEYILSKLKSMDEIERDIVTTLVTLSLCGWKVNQWENSMGISCSICSRRLVSWQDIDNSDVNEPAEKKQRTAEKQLTDEDGIDQDKHIYHLLNSHRSYCPWVKIYNEGDVSNFEYLSGYEQAIEAWKLSMESETKGKEDTEIEQIHYSPEEAWEVIRDAFKN